jgi:hypothetical protein
VFHTVWCWGEERLQEKPKSYTSDCIFCAWNFKLFPLLSNWTRVRTELASDLQPIPYPHCVNKTASQERHSFCTSLILMKRSHYESTEFSARENANPIRIIARSANLLCWGEAETNGEAGTVSIQRDVIAVKLSVNYMHVPSGWALESHVHGHESVAL